MSPPPPYPDPYRVSFETPPSGEAFSERLDWNGTNGEINQCVSSSSDSGMEGVQKALGRGSAPGTGYIRTAQIPIPHRPLPPLLPSCQGTGTVMVTCTAL
jgi:hypothetical protein